MGRWPYPITEIMERIAYATLKAAKAKQEAGGKDRPGPENNIDVSVKQGPEQDQSTSRRTA